jgi:hypothetical protein
MTEHIKLDKVVLNAESGRPELVCAACGDTVRIMPDPASSPPDPDPPTGRGCFRCDWWLRYPNDKMPEEYASGIIVKLGGGETLYWVGKDGAQEMTQ